ncbi:MAG TPA: GNAT family N-acyltransferase [Verrucomicrobiae bacterium]|nr:GNAT family N-acyltransferase [Verrucomicrobiae bacterium]
MAQVAGLKPVELLAGDIELRLAENEDEIRAAQALRYRIFYEEMSAEPTAEMQRLRRDFDSFDDYCDHLLVIDRALPAGPRRVVGTYRLLRRAMAEKRGQFYSVDEYDIRQILAFPGEILELGRSCIEPAYRQRSIMQLMWRGIADYVMYHEIGLMFGCASLAGVDPKSHALALSYLHHHHLAPANLRPRALPSRYVAMNMMARDQVDTRAALGQLPPLIKGYLRLGGFVGDGAVIDDQFHTTDVSVVVVTDRVTGKYYRHYTRAEDNRVNGDGEAVG